MSTGVKWLIASDLHGDCACTEALLEQFAASGASRLILLGDLLYHGPRNNLPSGYAPKRVIDLLNGVKEKLLCVRGNCDTEVDQMVLEFPILADYALLCADGLTFFATHGHRFHRNAMPPLTGGEILLHGHTHIPTAERLENSCFVVNPGSVSLPKGTSCNSYLLYENRHLSFRNLDGQEYRSYDF